MGSYMEPGQNQVRRGEGVGRPKQCLLSAANRSETANGSRRCKSQRSRKSRPRENEMIPKKKDFSHKSRQRPARKSQAGDLRVLDARFAASRGHSANRSKLQIAAGQTANRRGQPANRRKVANINKLQVAAPQVAAWSPPVAGSCKSQRCKSQQLSLKFAGIDHLFRIAG